MHISIIFIHFGMNDERKQLAQESFRSLIESVRQMPVEIIVVDNGADIRDSREFLIACDNGEITHYIRNADNLHFGYARNQALAMATGDYIAIVDNDLEYQTGWLKKCVDFLEAHKDKKYLATPIAYPRIGKCVTRYDVGEVIFNKEKWTLNMRAGSNCWVMSRQAYNEIGGFILHRIAGSKWTDKAVRMGYVSAVTPQPMIKDLGLRRGYNLAEDIVVSKKLLNGETVRLN